MNNASPASSPATFLSEEQLPPRSLDWKREVTLIVESHRARRLEPTNSVTGQRTVRLAQTAAHDRAARIAASVAARYATAPTYTELLERCKAADVDLPAKPPVEAEVSIEAPAANASTCWDETASDISRKSLEHPQMALSAASIDLTYSDRNINRPIDRPTPDPFDSFAALPLEPEYRPEPPIAGTIMLPDLPIRSAEMNMHAPETVQEPELEDLLASSIITPPVPLPANLIEFPRELIAPRRVRPQFAEGPLRTSHAAIAGEPAQAQLRIFEVEGLAVETDLPADTASEPSAEEPRASAWSFLCLDAQPGQEVQSSEEDNGLLSVPLQAASIDRRLMAAAMDFCLVTGAYLAFLLVFALSTPHLPSGKGAVVMGGVVYLALWILYQFLFFSLADATAGMRYARIALCTFEDENPSRRALRMRIAAWWISALPLGLGFAWAMLDEDNLSWHDRMCRMYQRCY